MRVYLPNKQSRVLLVAPGADVKDPPADWLDENGNAKTFRIDIQHGRVDVDKNMGEYLVSRGYAQRTPLHLPRFANLQQRAKAIQSL